MSSTRLIQSFCFLQMTRFQGNAFYHALIGAGLEVVGGADGSLGQSPHHTGFQ